MFRFSGGLVGVITEIEAEAIASVIGDGSRELRKMLI
jgi:hypothetical protein